MARVFAKALFGLSAAGLLSVGTAAQDPFADAVLSYRLGKFEDALKKYQDVLNRRDELDRIPAALSSFSPASRDTPRTS